MWLTGTAMSPWVKLEDIESWAAWANSPRGKPDFLPTLGGFDPTKPTNPNNQIIFGITAAHNMAVKCLGVN